MFGAPVHYSTAAASMLGFMHRLGYSAGRLLAQKPAAIVTSARRAGTTSALEALEKVPQFCQMPLISSTYWPMVHGSNAEQAALDEEGMQIMRNLPQHGLDLEAHCRRQSRRIEPPKAENTIRTNFIR